MSWLLALTGVILLSVLVDILLPSGQTNKFIKGIFSILIIFVILTPLLKLKNNDFSFSGLFDSGTIEVDETFIRNTKIRQYEQKEREIKEVLKNYEITVEELVITFDSKDINNITSVTVRTKNKEQTSTIKRIIGGILSVDEQYIIVYE